MKHQINDPYLLNIKIKAEVGDLVVFTGYNDKSEEVEKTVEIIEENEYMYIYEINKKGIKIGFHKSRLKKILKSKKGQLQIFNNP